ncbi:MAG TPA: hypothetical protein VK895_03705 [Jiangellaceae bacterium]|nr:hypothetical protein [Jiangellaceae bacterium]
MRTRRSTPHVGAPGFQPYRRPASRYNYSVEPDEISQERSNTAPIDLTRNEWWSDPARATDHQQTRNEGAKVVPSVTEVAVYTFLGAGIASAVFIVGERPYWYVAVVALAALVIVLLTALISRQNPRRLPTNFSANSRHGRRRRS